MAVLMKEAQRRIVAQQSASGHWRVEIWVGDLKLGQALTTDAEVYNSIRNKQKHFNIEDKDVTVERATGLPGEQIQMNFFVSVNRKPDRAQLLQEHKERQRAKQK